MWTSNILLGTFFGLYVADYQRKIAFDRPKVYCGYKINFGRQNNNKIFLLRLRFSGTVQ